MYSDQVRLRFLIDQIEPNMEGEKAQENNFWASVRKQLIYDIKTESEWSALCSNKVG